MSQITKFPDSGNNLAIREPKYTSGGDNGDGGGTTRERITRIEERLENTQKELSEVHQEVKGIHRWILTTAIASVLSIIAIIIAFGQWQAGWFQNSINANQTSNRELINELDKRWNAINEEREKRQEGTVERLDKTLDIIHNLELRLERNRLKK